jgi:hypothetical protein
MYHVGEPTVLLAMDAFYVYVLKEWYKTIFRILIETKIFSNLILSEVKVY